MILLNFLETDFFIERRSFFELFHVAQAERLVDAVTSRNKARRFIWIAVEMLMYGVDRDENQIAFFPIEALRFRSCLLYTSPSPRDS